MPTRQVSPTFAEASESLNMFVISALKEVNQEQPSTLWHYTSADGLLGIIGKQEIWMSHITCMNDSEEYQHGIKYLIKAIGLRLQSGLSDYLQEFYNSLISPVASMMNVGKIPSVFVACFSGETDKLTHWTEYGQHGLGYAIGFRAGELETATSSKALLLRCIYDDETKMRLLLQTLDEAERLLSHAIGAASDISPAMTANWFVSPLLEAVASFSPLFKHATFEPEQEWRLITFPQVVDLKVDYVARRNEIRELVIMPITMRNSGTPLIAEVKIGSNRDERLREISAAVITRYLGSQGLECVNVTESMSPYRTP